MAGGIAVVPGIDALQYLLYQFLRNQKGFLIKKSIKVSRISRNIHCGLTLMNANEAGSRTNLDHSRGSHPAP
jgi:hypothetical protein